MRIPTGGDATKPTMPALWAGRGVWTADGFGRNWNGFSLAQRARHAGFDWVALQAGQHGDAERRAVVDAGLRAVLWGIAPFDVGPGYDAVIVQVETEAQREAALAMLAKLPPRGDQGLAIVTTFGGSDAPAFVKPLLDYTDVAIVECYIQDDPIHADIPRMLWQARQYGWPLAVPIIGLYREKTLADYPTLDVRGGFSVWRAETMRDADWDDIARLPR